MTKPTHNINGRSDWRYATAAETVKPGYLARKFAAYRKQREAEEKAREEESRAKVRKLR